MNPLLLIGTTLGGGLLNLIGNDQANSELNKRKARIRSILEESYITPNELDNILNNVHRIFNTQLSSTLNKTALTGRTIANNNVLQASVLGELASKEATVLANTQQSVLDKNQQVSMKLAELELMGDYESPLSSFFGGATSGLTLGLEATKIFQNAKLLEKLFKGQE